MHRRPTSSRPSQVAAPSQSNVLSILQKHETQLTRLSTSLASLPSADSIQAITVELQRSTLRFQKIDNHLQSMQSSLKSALARITDLELIVESINKQTGGGTELGTVRCLLNEMREDLSVLKDTTTKNGVHLTSLNEEDKTAALKKAVSEVSSANLRVIREIMSQGKPLGEATEMKQEKAQEQEQDNEDVQDNVTVEAEVEAEGEEAEGEEAEGEEETEGEAEGEGEDEVEAEGEGEDEGEVVVGEGKVAEDGEKEDVVSTLGDEMRLQESDLESIRKAVGEAVRQCSDGEELSKDEGNEVIAAES